MPNLKSAKKELRKSKKRNVFNSQIEDNLKKLTKKTRKAIDSKDKKAGELLQAALKAYDKAAQKGVIKKNARDRKKSRLHQKFNSAHSAK